MIGDREKLHTKLYNAIKSADLLQDNGQNINSLSITLTYNEAWAALGALNKLRYEQYKLEQTGGER